MIKKDLLKNKKNFIYVFLGIIFFIILILLLCFFISSNRKLNMSSFEKIAINGYLEEFLTPSKIYFLSGKMDMNEQEYLQALANEAIESYSDTIPVAKISNYITKHSILEIEDIDFHSIVINGYEYSPENKAYIKSENAPHTSLTTISDYDENLNTKIISIEKTNNNKYKINFNLVDSSNNSSVSSSGNAIISIKNDSTFNIDSCNLND